MHRKQQRGKAGRQEAGTPAAAHPPGAKLSWHAAPAALAALAPGPRGSPTAEPHLDLLLGQHRALVQHIQPLQVHLPAPQLADTGAAHAACGSGGSRGRREGGQEGQEGSARQAGEMAERAEQWQAQAGRQPRSPAGGRPLEGKPAGFMHHDHAAAAGAHRGTRR